MKSTSKSEYVSVNQYPHSALDDISVTKTYHEQLMPDHRQTRKTKTGAVPPYPAQQPKEPAPLQSAITKILIFIVAYNAEKTINSVLTRIPHDIQNYDTEVLIIDDSSKDSTFEKALAHDDFPFKLTILYNPDNQGYGGNQKIGFHYAIKNDFDVVALVHGDGQYAPERLPALLSPIVENEADVVFGSRMLEKGAAIKGGMPLYKYIGNKILTAYQNLLLGSHLSEFHSGYRIYSVNALRAIPFELNTNVFHFDTEIIIQLMLAGQRIKEVPIPTYYGNEICNVDGLKYAYDVFKTTLLASIQRLGIFYQKKYDISHPGEQTELYQSKLGFDSSHTLAIESIHAGSAVLDVGSAGGYIAKALKEKGCYVVGLDQHSPNDSLGLGTFIKANIDNGQLPVHLEKFDYILMLDVIEHLAFPDVFVANLAKSVRRYPDIKLVITTGNVAFLPVRLALLFGFLHYSKRGILDFTHKRLFTFASLRQLFEQYGFKLEVVKGIPAPFPLALGYNRLSRTLLIINRWLITIARKIFSYQIYFLLKPSPSLDWLLDQAERESGKRAEMLHLNSDAGHYYPNMRN